MAIGVYNPHKPGETVWLFRFEDLRDLIPDDIYKAIFELVEVDEADALRAEVEDWEKWHDEHLEEDTRLFQDFLEELDEILNKLSDRSKKLDRGDLISRFTELRKQVADQF